MANTHTKLSARVEDPQYRVRQRNVGGKLHRRGQKRKPQEASPIIAKAVVAHVERQDFALRARVRVAIEHANARGQAARAAGADQRLWFLSNIRHLPPIEEREAHVAQLFAQYGK